ncbi:MAG: hypothetical protein LC104_06665 [Bacteroidales bacterium]|nr:hypothetical protein [Bacteroidales bacterium]
MQIATIKPTETASIPHTEPRPFPRIVDDPTVQAARERLKAVERDYDTAAAEWGTLRREIGSDSGGFDTLARQLLAGDDSASLEAVARHKRCEELAVRTKALKRAVELGGMELRSAEQAARERIKPQVIRDHIAPAERRAALAMVRFYRELNAVRDVVYQARAFSGIEPSVTVPVYWLDSNTKIAELVSAGILTRDETDSLLYSSDE